MCIASQVPNIVKTPVNITVPIVTLGPAVSISLPKLAPVPAPSVVEVIADAIHP